MRDKKYRDLLTILEDGCILKLKTSSGTVICDRYERVVIGLRGPYVELTKNQINEKCLYIPSEQLYRLTDPRIYYIEFRTNDESNVKVYYQMRTVAYADYRIGYFYISTSDLQKDNGDVCIKSDDSSFKLAGNFFEFEQPIG